MHALGAESARQARWRRAARATFAFSFLGIVVVLGLFVRLPLLVLEPGPAPDVAKRTTIEAPTFPSEGSIHLTTAQVRAPQGASGRQILAAIFDPDQLVLPRDVIYPSGESNAHTESVQAAQMTQSELEAAVAALSELGLPYEPQGVFVSEVDEDAPAARDLVPGDIITTVDSREVRTLQELTDALKDRPAGDTVRLGVRRGSRTLELTVDTAGEDGGAGLAAELVQYNKAPIDVSISSRDIGGPSAGLMYALSIYDRLVPEDITGGRKIAGTGTIENPAGRSGVVGAVGSVELKVKGASRIGAGVFLVPKPELDEARAAAGSGMEVIGVSTLKEAIAELKRLPKTKVAQKKT